MEPTNLVNEAMVVLIKVLAATLALLVTYYAPKLFKAIEKKLKFDIPDEREVEAITWGKRAIAYGEEYGRKKAAQLSRKVPSNEKLDAAAGYFRDHASPEVVAWVNGKVESWLESLLGFERSRGPTPAWAEDDGTP